jgi:predicted DNA-binding protein (MmcQ/YjbR family)
MSPVHWSAVRLDGSAPSRTVAGWIRQSYNLVVAGLPKKIRTQYPVL